MNTLPDLPETLPLHANVQRATDRQFAARHGPDALFVRYAQNRIHQLGSRLFATFVAVLAIWFFVSLEAALITGSAIVLGEVLDVGVLFWARRAKDREAIARAKPWTIASAGAHAAPIAGSILFFLMYAQSGEQELIALCFLMVSAINAGFMLTHHPTAARLKLAIYATCLPVFLATDAIASGGFGAPQILHLLEVLLLGFTTYTFVHFAVRTWQNRLAHERALLESAARLDATNHELLKTQRRVEQAAQAKSVFLATMSHEIRTPLNAVIGMSDLLTAADLDKDARLYVDTIHTASTSLLAIINDVLDFSRLDADRMAFEALPFAPSETIAASARMLTPLAQKKGLRLVLADDGSLPMRASADEGRLRQILVNLIGNAIKFTQTGEVRITSRAEHLETGWRLVIDVADSGIGVPPERAEAIFEVFQQADAATTRRFGGTGLGLPISRSLARRMGGDIHLLPPGETPGATFELSVMLDKAPAEEAARPPGLVPVAQGFARPLNVLIADDNDTNRMLVRRFLKSEPVTLSEARDGVRAVEMAETDGPDVILMDMSMPELDGLEACRQIRAKDMAQPVILAVTANAFASDREACLAAGMDDFLPKPIRKAQLVGKLAQISREEKPLPPIPDDAISQQGSAGGPTTWTLPHGSGTTNGKSIRSSGR